MAVIWTQIIDQALRYHHPLQITHDSKIQRSSDFPDGMACTKTSDKFDTIGQGDINADEKHERAFDARLSSFLALSHDTRATSSRSILDFQTSSFGLFA